MNEGELRKLVKKNQWNTFCYEAQSKEVADDVINIRDLLEILDLATREFPRVPAEQTSCNDILVQDFLTDIRIWSRKWLGDYIE
jgi:hypothetical protein